MKKLFFSILMSSFFNCNFIADPIGEAQEKSRGEVSRSKAKAKIVEAYMIKASSCQANPIPVLFPLRVSQYNSCGFGSSQSNGSSTLDVFRSCQSESKYVSKTTVNGCIAAIDVESCDAINKLSQNPNSISTEWYSTPGIEAACREFTGGITTIL